MRYLLLVIFVSCHITVQAQSILVGGRPGRLTIRKAADNSLRITLRPAGLKEEFPFTPALADHTYPAPVVSITSITQPITKRAGNLQVKVSGLPLTIVVSNAAGEAVQ